MHGPVPVHHHQCSFCGATVECRTLWPSYHTRPSRQHRYVCDECIEKHVNHHQQEGR